MKIQLPDWLVAGRCFPVSRLISDETYFELTCLADTLRRPAVVLVQAAATPPAGSEVIHAQIAPELPAIDAGKPLPTDIQWMPPGQHVISASVNGKPGTRKVNVTAKVAERAQAALAANLAAVQAGTEDRFYFDLNHADGEASAHPTEFYWGGDDPRTGGVRAKLEWTGAGEAAVKGKNYRRFSPSFYLDAAGEVTGVPVNAGGLVNRAAFKKIQAITAKEQPNPTKDNTMEKLSLILASLGIIKKHDASEDTIVSEVQAFFAENKRKLDEAAEVKAKFDTLSTDHGTLVRAHATSAVEAAINGGKLPGKDEALKASWIEMIVANPASEKLLASLQPNPALQSVVKAKGAGEQTHQLQGGDAEHPFIVKAKAMATDKNVSLDYAMGEVARLDAKSYDNYRESLLTE